MKELCPHCEVNLQGAPIPEHLRQAGWYGDPAPTHFSRTLGVEVQGAYDGVLFYQCPDCGGRWHRWPEGTWEHRRAQVYINASSD